MTDLFPMLGSWFWWIIAAALLIGEMIAPGFFLLWLAVAAALTGLIDFLFGFGWQGEVAIFAGLSMALILLTWHMVSAQWRPNSDQPNLNRRIHGYVGQSFVLEQPIVNGRGKLRIQDALWDVMGPDLPAGTKVSVTGVQDMQLTVTPV
jgi:membrane protein implicated in regulation of membrane protease activity